MSAARGRLGVIGEIRELSSAGTMWTIFEFVDLYDRRGTSSLVFESEAIVRRVRNFPRDWRSWSNDALIELSLTAI